jgi:hypothetical protein
MEVKFSYYENKFKTENTDLSLENYVGFIQHGSNQDLVLKARSVYQREGKSETYKKIKNSSKAITGSCTFASGDAKNDGNIKQMNGLIVLDLDVAIDGEKYDLIKNDKYTHIIHRSFSGDNYCAFIKIDPLKFDDSFLGLSEYYYNTFEVTIDPSCSNRNRLRYISYDPDIYHNPKSIKFVPKDVKRFKEPKSVNYVFHEDDFDFILTQIKQESLDLCQEDYFRYVRIGMAIASKFGSSGLDKFKFICQFGGKYNEKRTEKDYAGFVKNGTGKCTIGTFYYYCKEAGVSVYTEKTKTIINRVKVGKTQGTPTVESIVSNLSVANNIIASDPDRILIEELIISTKDYSKEANDGISEIEQLQQFVIDTYSPVFDVITNMIFVNGDERLGSKELNDIYLECKKSFPFNVAISDIRSIINSNAVKKINVLEDFIKENDTKEYSGYIDDYINCVHPNTEFNRWAFKKWLVGALHNWTCNKSEKVVCPLTLVLTGQQHGTGKTSFLRNIMPAALDKYSVEEKISATNKDSIYRMCSSLIIIDDEFGGKAFKDVKEYKSVADINTVTQRRPYGSEDDIFKRRAILCGTTNEVDILKDVTGNRRILPINVEKVDYAQMLSIDKIGLIMEAYQLLKSGFKWIIQSSEDIEYIKVNTSQNEHVIPIEEIFFNHFKLTKGGVFMKEVIMNQGEILEYLNLNSVLKPTKYDLKEVLTKNKMDYKLHRMGDEFKKGLKLFMRYTGTETSDPVF